MIKHVVLFALEGFASTEELNAHLEVVRQALEALPDQIDYLLGSRVHLNENPYEEYHLILEVEVSSLEDLARYAADTAHQRVALELIKPYLKARACVDYTVTT